MTGSIPESIRFRPNVAAIVRRKDGRILIGERSDLPGAWQFPQGGIHSGETAEVALKRELMEEIRLDAAHFVIGDSKGPYRYLFPNNRMKSGFHGQEQVYFLLELTGADSAVSIDVPEPEFRELRWILPGGFDLQWVMPVKRPVYAAVFRDFFGVNLQESQSVYL